MKQRRGVLGSIMKRLHAPFYRSRLRELVRQIVPHLGRGDRVLDVGCGFGTLGRAIMDDPAAPGDVEDNTRRQWADLHRHHGLEVELEVLSMNLYPPVVNLLLGRRLHYLAVLRIEKD